jgi:TPR repeat protein
MSAFPATPPCAACGAPATSRCAACAGAHYCSAACQRAAWPHHKVACARAAQLLEGRPLSELDSRIDELLAWAAADDANAQLALAHLYARGAGVAEDAGEAVRLSQAAAGAGHLGAQIFAALAAGEAGDAAAAAAWWERAAAEGAPRRAEWAGEDDAQDTAEACFELADCLMFGRGVAVDKRRAVKLWNRAAIAGSARASQALLWGRGK